MDLCAGITPASQKGQEPEDPVNYLVVPNDPSGIFQLKYQVGHRSNLE